MKGCYDMKKVYEQPNAEIVEVCPNDIILTSGELPKLSIDESFEIE